MSSDPAFSSDPAVMSRPDSRWRERHAVLAAGYGGRDDPADPALVLAMPIVLPHSEGRPAQAHRTARGCGNGGCGAVSGRTRRVHRRRGTRPVARGLFGVGGCPDPESVSPSAWEPSGSPRKRCRESPSTWMVPRRGLWFPGRSENWTREIKKLQIGGTDLEHDEPGPPEPGLPVLWIDSALEMTVGKGVGTGRACLDVVGGGQVRETVLGLGAERLSLLSARCEPGTVGRSSSSAEEVGGRRGFVTLVSRKWHQAP